MRRSLILGLVPVFVLAAACGESGVLEPEAEASFAAAAVKQQTFCTSVAFAGPVETPEFWTTGNVQHFCGANAFAHGDDLVGTAIHRGCSTTNLTTGVGRGHGSLEMELTEAFGEPVSGGFEGRWLIVLEGTRRTGAWWGTGYGDFEGTRLRVDLDFDALDSPLVICGFIHDPHGP